MTNPISQVLNLPTGPVPITCQILHPKAKHFAITLGDSDNSLFFEMFMSEGWATGKHVVKDDPDEDEIIETFYDNHCYNCPYNDEFVELSSNKISELYIHSKDLDADLRINYVYVYSPCSYHISGSSVIGEMIDRDESECPAGNFLPSLESNGDTEETDISYDGVSFRCNYDYGSLSTWSPSDSSSYYSARFSKISLDEETGEPFLIAEFCPPVNVYGDGLICWGENAEPCGIGEAADQYSKTDSNDDLTDIDLHKFYQDDLFDEHSIASKIKCYLSKSKVYWDLDEYRGTNAILIAYKDTFLYPSAYNLLCLYGQSLGKYSFMLVTHHDKFKSSDGKLTDVWVSQSNDKTRLVFKSISDDSVNLQYIGTTEAA